MTHPSAAGHTWDRWRDISEEYFGLSELIGRLYDNVRTVYILLEWDKHEQEYDHICGRTNGIGCIQIRNGLFFWDSC